MAYGQDGDYIEGKADADFSIEGTAQYRGAKRTATGIALCAVNDADFAGILYNNPRLGQSASVKRGGSCKGVAGAAFARGAKVTTDANGRFVTATVGQRVHATAEQAATASGDLVALHIRPGLETAP